MARYGQVKVTIVGYYTVSEHELENYGVTEFDVTAMAKVDDEEYRKTENIHDVIDWFSDGRPTSVTFEAVDISGTDPDC